MFNTVPEATLLVITPLNAPVVALTVPPDWLVAVVAVKALPLKDAVIVLAEKLPEASRATTVEAVFADAAFTVHVCAAEPLYAVPVRYVPAVRLFKLEPSGTPEIVPVDHENVEPLKFKTVFVPEAAVMNDVAPEPVW